MKLWKSDRPLSLRKSRHVFRAVYRLYRRRGHKLSDHSREELEAELEALDNALVARDRTEANRLAHRVDEMGAELFPKRALDYGREVVIAVVLAILVAVVVRQMWFEPMEIPSGSMRPTFEELDRLVVNKTTFGLNVPMKPAHFYFDPDLVERTGVFIFTSEDMDIADQDTTYFGFPSKRRLIKRNMGLGGDTLYFYGGTIYGFDRDGHEITDYAKLDGIDSVPFITFQGKSRGEGPIEILQMNQPVGRLDVKGGKPHGEVFNGQSWVPDQPYLETNDAIHTYSDLYGMRDYAMARLLTGDELAAFSEAPLEDLHSGLLYLELRHHPSLTYPAPFIGRTGQGQLRPVLIPEVSVIPLDEEHLDAIMSTMYTARFIVENGRAYADRLKNEAARQSGYRPYFPNVPDGRYEFRDGTLYKVAWGGILQELPRSHPLYSRDPANVQNLFNFGMEFTTAYQPRSRNQTAFPTRYAWYKHGALDLMGGTVFTPDDPTLADFLAREERRTKRSTPARPYLPFIDHGPPLTPSGELDLPFITTFGLHIPEGHYLALGDNYAASSDSRVFGFVPAENLRGTPSILLWPPGPRWATVAKPHYPWFTLPRVLVWGGAALIIIAYVLYRRYRNRRPTFRRL